MSESSQESVYRRRLRLAFELARDLLRLESRDVIAILIFGLTVSFFSLILPIGVQAMVNALIATVAVQPIIVLIAVICLGLVIAGVFRLIQIYLAELLQRRVFMRVALDLGLRITRMKNRELFARDGRELVNRYFDVFKLQKSITNLLTEGVATVFQAALGLLLLAFYHPYFIAFALILVVGVAVIVYMLGRNALVTSLEESTHQYEVAAWLESLIGSRQLLTNDSMLQHAHSITNQKVASSIEASRKHFRILFRQIIGIHFLQVAASALLLLIGAILVIQNQISLGQLVAGELIVSGIMNSLVRFHKELESYYDMVAGFDKVGQMFDVELEQQEGLESIALAKPPRLEMVEVTALRPDGQIAGGIHQLNLKLASGNSLALKGPHGAGKGLILRLFAGLQLPDSGRVEVDGINLQYVELAAYRKQVLLISEDNVMYGTIMQNLCLDGETHSIKSIERVLKQLGLLEAINQLPEGLNTHLSASGQPLSPGQNVQLALARALLMRPRVLLIEQVLDSLEEGSANRILGLLFDKKQPWTLVVSTNSNAVSRRCDQVVKLKLNSSTAKVQT